MPTKEKKPDPSGSPTEEKKPDISAPPDTSAPTTEKEKPDIGTSPTKEEKPDVGALPTEEEKSNISVPPDTGAAPIEEEKPDIGTVSTEEEKPDTGTLSTEKEKSDPGVLKPILTPRPNFFGHRLAWASWHGRILIGTSVSTNLVDLAFALVRAYCSVRYFCWASVMIKFIWMRDCFVANTFSFASVMRSLWVYIYRI